MTIAFARISSSGTLRADTTVHVFGPKYDPNTHHAEASGGSGGPGASASGSGNGNGNGIIPANAKYVTTVRGGSGLKLFLMMGREIEPIDSVPAGNVFGIAGLEKFILSTATISTLPRVVPFRGMTFQVRIDIHAYLYFFPSVEISKLGIKHSKSPLNLREFQSSISDIFQDKQCEI